MALFGTRSREKLDSQIKPMNVEVNSQESIMQDGTTLVTKTDLHGKITYANKNFADIAEMTADELVGKPHNVIRHPDMPRGAFHDLWLTLQRGKPWKGMVKNRTKSGGFYWVDANVAQRVENNEIVGYISIRRKPDRRSVEAAEELYRKMRNGKAAMVYSDKPMMSIRMKLMLFILFAVLPMILTEVLTYFNSPIILNHIIDISFIALIISYGLYITRFILKPLKEATDIAVKMAKGDLRVNITHNRNDEIGDLQKGLLSMLVNTAGIIAEIQENVVTLNESSQKLKESSQSLSVGMEETSTQSENIAAASDEMNQTLQVLAGSVEEMSISIGEVSTRASNSAKIVENANSSAEMANSVVMQLGDSASEIGNVVETIGNIAAQTNLLALNASIEAAGAGDAGKGFAVVANEVKELARQSAESSIAVKEKVETIQKNVKETVNAMKTIMETFSEVKEISSTIASAVEEQSIASKEIANNVSQVSTASNDVTKNVNGISATAKEGALSSTQSSGMAIKVDNAAKILEQVAKLFQV